MTYRSIFLADDWAHQAYYGWRVVADEPGIRVLGKQRSVAKRFLLLLTAPGRERLGFWIRRLAGITGLSDIVIHDFDSVLGAHPIIFGQLFRLAKQHERLLNITTFVIDLAKTDNELIAQMSSDYRRKIRKAASNGVTVEAHSQPDAALQKHFVDVLHDFATERKLNVIDGGALAAMYRDGRGLLLVTRKQGEVSNFLHLYKAGDAAIFMYGVNLSKVNDGVGQFLHFEAMRRLREHGVRWYDLGGVASTDPADGIFNFKQKFGGELVDLGREWRHTGAVAAAGMALVKVLKRLTGQREIGGAPLATPTRRVAIVFNDLLPFGGAEKLAMNIAADQIAHGYSVDIVLLNEPQNVTDVVPPGARVIKLEAPRARNALLPLIGYLRRERPDAVLASMWPMTTLMVVANMLAGSPARVIVSDHNPLSIQYAQWGRLHRHFLKATIWLTYRFASARVAVSQGVAADVAQLSSMERKAFDVIYNPINVPVATDAGRMQAEAAWQGADGKRILAVGRLKRQKNHQLLIAAFAKVLERRNARLVILGTGELEVQTRAVIDAAGLAGKVVLGGQVTDTSAWYESADLFVLSSDYEGFGNVIVEAMATGLPVVSTDCPYGPAEILADGKYGRLVPVGDAEALSDAVIRALDDTPDAEWLRRRAADISGSNSLERYSELFHGSATTGRDKKMPCLT